jgi:two-component system sensor histidine kinase DegS
VTTPAELAERLTAEADQVERELTEIGMLITQARTEAARHEQRRAAAAEKLSRTGGRTDPADLTEQGTQLATLTRRATLMEAQIEVLEGKRRPLERLRDGLREAADAFATLGPGDAAAAESDGADADADEEAQPQAMNRLVLAAQEDLRRDIARAMHDGPAQSLTNIVLQADIVEHLVTRDPVRAAAEVRLLTEMVERTLEATKTFIFDVRPMVLDDLGLVPTLRRAARDRGRRAGIPVAFESVGVDRRLAVELESGLFRVVDEALTAYLAAAPDSLSLQLDWGDELTVELRASRAVPEAPAPVAPPPPPPAKGKGAKELPPALASMVEERAADARAAAEAARIAARVVLPAATWRSIAGRAAALGFSADLVDEGAAVAIRVSLAGDEGSPEAVTKVT